MKNVVKEKISLSFRRDKIYMFKSDIRRTQYRFVEYLDKNNYNKQSGYVFWNIDIKSAAVFERKIAIDLVQYNEPRKFKVLLGYDGKFYSLENKPKKIGYEEINLVEVFL